MTATQSINQFVSESGARYSVARSKLLKPLAHCMAAGATNAQPAIFPIPERVNRLRAMIISGHAVSDAQGRGPRSTSMIERLTTEPKRGAL